MNDFVNVYKVYIRSENLFNFSNNFCFVIDMIYL